MSVGVPGDLKGRTLLWWGRFPAAHRAQCLALVEAGVQLLLAAPSDDALAQEIAQADGIRCVPIPPDVERADVMAGWLREVGAFDDVCYVPHWKPSVQAVKSLPSGEFASLLQEMAVLRSVLSALISSEDERGGRLFVQILPEHAAVDSDASLPLLVHIWSQALIEIFAHEIKPDMWCLCSLQFDPQREQEHDELVTFFQQALSRPEEFQGIHHETVLQALEQHPPPTPVVASSLPSSGERELQQHAQQISHLAAYLEAGLRILSDDFNKLGFVRRRLLRRRFLRDTGLRIEDWIAQLQRMNTSWHHLAVLRQPQQIPIYARDLVRAEQKTLDALQDLASYLHKTPQEASPEQTQRFQQIYQRRQKMSHALTSLETLLKDIQSYIERSAPTV
ncbi:MAG: hypothetical protein CL920_06930 [Deltaproteobacteria bacterium]|nr:hypothetical protein [Deltaproteobacteria bacterium]